MFTLTELAVRLINLVAPKQCVMCGCRLAVGEDVVCTSCNLGLPRTNYHEKPYDNEMAKLFWGRMPVEKAAALFFYRAHSASSRIVYSMKQTMAPSPAELKLHPFMQNLNKGIALFDGAMTGIKIIRRVKAFLKRMK